LKALLFDLDGTLLKVDMQRFIPAYLDGLSTSLGGNLAPAEFRAVARSGILQLLANRQSAGCNRARFLGILQQQLHIAPEIFARALADFCQGGLQRLRPMVEPLPVARELLDRAFASGYKVVIATNPVFPREIVQARLEWGGLADYPFDLITDWDNCAYCKPAPGYFQDLLAKLDLQPEQALMVGNDTGHDLAAGHVGIPTFLVDTWLIERDDGSPPPTWRGNHQQLVELLEQLG
jgi:FMN phosphatase YigB (HAD superfamily)